MLLNTIAENQDVIQVYQNTFVQQIKKYLIHGPLKGGWGVTKPKWHNNKFKTAKFCTKGSFEAICGAHGELVVAISKVQFWKYLGTLELAE